MNKQRITLEAPNLLPPKKAAEYLGVTTMTLWRWVQDGKLACIMLDHSYFHINELDRVKALRKERNKKAVGGEPAPTAS